MTTRRIVIRRTHKPKTTMRQQEAPPTDRTPHSWVAALVLPITPNEVARVAQALNDPFVWRLPTRDGDVVDLYCECCGQRWGRADYSCEGSRIAVTKRKPSRLPACPVRGSS